MNLAKLVHAEPMSFVLALSESRKRLSSRVRVSKNYDRRSHSHTALVGQKVR